MGQSTDQIRREIEESRASAATKIDELQSQVEGTAQGVKDTVTGTTEEVINQVKGSVDETVQSVRENLDVRQRIEQRPLLSLGVALVGGFVLGSITGKDDRGHSSYHTYSYQQPESNPGSGYRSHNQQGGSLANGIRSAVQSTGLEDTISSAAAAMIGSLTEQVKTRIDQNYPGFADRMKTAQSSSGGFAEKAREAQQQATEAKV